MGPATWRPQEKVGPAIGAHRTLVRPAIAALTVRSAIGAHRILVKHAMRSSQRGCHHGAHIILVWPAIAELTVRPAIATLTMFINDKNFLKKNIFSNMIQLD